MTKWFRILGIIGTIAFLVIFITHPSWPTPDKLLVFMTFVFMSFGQATEMLKRFVPFVGLLLIYESFRGLADGLNHRVAVTFMANADKAMFGGVLPTAKLQQWFWHGTVQWYDFVFYIMYMLHFILPIGLAILVWKKRAQWYWRVVSTYVVLSFMGFITFLAYPAAPPWMASDMGKIPPIVRISDHVFAVLGFKDFPTVYKEISPNAVAAVPSLHAGYATIFALFVFKIFGKKWGILSLIYPMGIFVGTVYAGEHYAFDELLGILYAVAAYFVVIKAYNKIKKRHSAKNIVAESVITES